MGGWGGVCPHLGWTTSGPSSGTESSPPRSCQWDACTCWEGVKASFEPHQDPITLPTELSSGVGGQSIVRTRAMCCWQETMASIEEI